MAETIGLPAPPPVGATALAPDTFAGTSVFVTGGGTGLGKAIASEFARLGAAIVIASRKDEHLDSRARGDGGTRRERAGRRLRHPRTGIDRERVRYRDRVRSGCRACS